MGIALGIGVAAACGFRVFVPLLVLALAARFGFVPLSSDMQWLASNLALVALGTATLFEVVAYSVPWLDHFLDVVATPAAVVAGIIASASVLTEVPPLVKWGVALIAGGGAAGIVQGATVLTRLHSTAATGGLANPLFAAVEFFGSVLTVILAIVLPVVVLLAVVAFCVIAFKLAGRFAFGRRAAEKAAAAGTGTVNS
jgi:hypothetical protein